jgi:hypothetical protein
VREFKFQDSALITAGRTYSFRTYSRNVKGFSAASNSIAITAATIPAQMAPPTRVGVVIDPATLRTTVTIAWTALTAQQAGGTPVTGYRIRQNFGYDTSIPATPYVEIPDPTQLQYTFDGQLLIGVTYQIVIAALNDVHTLNQFDADGSAELHYSELLQIQVANLPAQVTNVRQQASDYEAGKIKLLWDAPSTFETVGSAITRYTILKDVGSGVFYALTTVDGRMLSYTDVNLVAGQRHNYKVLATTSIGDGAASAVCTGTAGEEPGRVETLRIVTQSSTTVTFAWDPTQINHGGLALTGYLVS